MGVPRAAAREKKSGSLTASVQYLVVVFVIISNETTATARWALLFIFRAFVNDSITVALWTSFHVCTPYGTSMPGAGAPPHQERKLLR
jgi:hypothetical protein